MRRHVPSIKRKNTLKKKASEAKEKEANGDENESSVGNAESAPGAGRKKLVRQKPSRQG